MIKFFRRIRKKLLSENKLSQYFLYAVGEILLVVLGILIAVQINNWSANKKELQLENKMLKEIKIALESDLDDISFNFDYQKDILKSQNTILEWLKSDKPYSDSLSRHFFKVVDGTSFLANYGSYETLKGIGVQLIKDDSLRKAILELYELRYDEYTLVSKQVNDYRFQLISVENERFFNATSPFVKMKPLDVQKLREGSGYTYHLTTLISWNQYLIEYKLLPTKLKLEKVIRQIEQKIEN